MPTTSNMSSFQQGSNFDPTAQMNTFRSYVSMLADPGSKDENKLKAAQALSEDLEVQPIHKYILSTGTVLIWDPIHLMGCGHMIISSHSFKIVSYIEEISLFIS
ncbi:unnamed protein product [Rotaria magnacalcarata]|uniref:Uncharacterized protein n=1 Tax=Rotaria magnacalcarata TaxID=392030 RepID=A0A820CIF8_9BILA|nr:unnamed protein product [Rotaria magnacalcarata]